MVNFVWLPPVTVAMVHVTRPNASGAPPSAIPAPELLIRQMSAQEREELAYSLLSTLPRAQLINIRRRIDPLLQLDIVGFLPDELALHVLSFLPWQSLLRCSLVSRHWHALANDSWLWRALCRARGCDWKQPSRSFNITSPSSSFSSQSVGDTDDEGMGDEEDVVPPHEHDSGFISMDIDNSMENTTTPPHSVFANLSTNVLATPPSMRRLPSVKNRHSAPPVLPTLFTVQPNYKLLHQTHTRIHNRFLCASYRLSTLQTRPPSPITQTARPHSPHTNTIYCLQLYTHPQTGLQTLFTGSKDMSIREWNIYTSQVIRIVDGVHTSSILSLCVNGGLLVSAGSDKVVAVWDLNRNELSKSIKDHEDSVLAVRFDQRRLVSCSKDRTLRTYLFPDLTPHLILRGHRAAVNAVAISDNLIVSASGDRSMAMWDADTGQLIRSFENHHSRGIASIDLKPPYLLSGSSDKHIRLIDLSTGNGWSTNADFDMPLANDPYSAILEADEDEDFVTSAAAGVCDSCGTEVSSSASLDRLGGAGSRARVTSLKRYSSAHSDLVRSVVMGNKWVASGSYDSSVKIWNRKTGAFVAELTGGHTGRIFCVGFDGTKLVSVGEDQRICIWDFAHGLDTSFIKL